MTEEKNPVPLSPSVEGGDQPEDRAVEVQTISPVATESNNGNPQQTEPEKNDAEPLPEQTISPEQAVAELENKYKETYDRLLRTAAELENVRRRSRRDADEAVIRGKTEVLRGILPVIDSIDLALKAAESNGSAEQILQGVEITHKQFLTATERFGLKPIESVGRAFDPNFHEAVAHIHSGDHPAGTIIEEMRKGYLLGDRLLRAAMVIVSKGPQAEAAAEEQSETESSAMEEVSTDEPANDL